MLYRLFFVVKIVEVLRGVRERSSRWADNLSLERQLVNRDAVSVGSPLLFVQKTRSDHPVSLVVVSDRQNFVDADHEQNDRNDEYPVEKAILCIVDTVRSR
jgi:hypothetical protein